MKGRANDEGGIADPAADEAEEETTMQPSALEDVYDVGEVIGHGHFATVRKGVHRHSGEQVAIKAIQKTRTDSSTIRREIEILRRVGTHKNIVNLLDVFETENEWFLVMEVPGCPGALRRCPPTLHCSPNATTGRPRRSW
jgi:serine/threonine protein kinase